MTTSISFDEISVMSSLVTILTPYLQQHLGKVYDDQGVLTDVPAFLVRSQLLPTSTYPRITISYSGDREVSGHTFKTYVEEYDDPDILGNKLYRRVTEKYIRYVLTVVADSGPYQDVLSGQVKSSNYILRYIKNLLMSESVRKEINTQMLSGVEQILTITQQYNLDETVETDSSVMSIPFTTVDTLIEEGIDVFDTIEWDANLRYDDEDTSPIPITGSVTSRTP